MEFGVNLNDREPLITPDYTLADVLDLAELAYIVSGSGVIRLETGDVPSPDYPPTERREPAR